MAHYKLVLKVCLYHWLVIFVHANPYDYHESMEPQFGNQNYNSEPILSRKGPFENPGHGLVSRRSSILHNPDAKLNEFYLAYRQDGHDDDYSVADIIDKDKTTYLNMDDIKEKYGSFETKASGPNDYTRNSFRLSEVPIRDAVQKAPQKSAYNPWTAPPESDEYYKENVPSRPFRYTPVNSRKNEFMKPYKSYNSYGRTQKGVYRSNVVAKDFAGEEFPVRTNTADRQMKNSLSEPHVMEVKPQEPKEKRQKPFSPWGGKRSSLQVSGPVRQFINDPWKSLVFSYSREFDDPNYFMKGER